MILHYFDFRATKNILEIIKIDNKTSANIAQQFANAWLSQ